MDVRFSECHLRVYCDKLNHTRTSCECTNSLPCQPLLKDMSCHTGGKKEPGSWGSLVFDQQNLRLNFRHKNVLPLIYFLLQEGSSWHLSRMLVTAADKAMQMPRKPPVEADNS